MDRHYILDIMKSKDVTIDEFNYDKLTCPPIKAFFTDYDLQRLAEIATSLRYSSKPHVKYQEIDKIMKSRGFSKLSAGTNRVVYKCIENDTFVAKVAYDAIGIKDNPKEFINQNYLKPFCAKTFEVAPAGVLAFSERVNPITNREQFLSVAEDVFTLISEFIINGEIIMDDIGSNYFMNYGLRVGFGPVLLDYSSLHFLDGNKLYCCRPDPTTETKTCGGLLDYDSGFNKILCQKCGTRYLAKDLELKIKDNQITTKSFKGEFNKMKVSLKGGSKNYDLTTTINTIEVNDPKAEAEETVVYTDKKKKVHVSLGHRNDPEITIINNKKVAEEVVAPVVEETHIDEEAYPQAITEEAKNEDGSFTYDTVLVESKEQKEKLTTPIKMGGEVKTDNDNIRDLFNDASKLFADLNISSKLTTEHINTFIKGIDFVIKTMRDSELWNNNDATELFENKLYDIVDNHGEGNIKYITSQVENPDDSNEVLVSFDIVSSISDNRLIHREETVVNIKGEAAEDEIGEDVSPAKEIASDEISKNETDEDIQSDEYNFIEYTEIEDEEHGEEADDEFYDNPIPVTGYVAFSARIIDISTKILNEESKNVIVIDDGNGGFLTVGDGDKYLVIDQLDGINSNDGKFVSKHFIDNVVKEVEEKATELTSETFKDAKTSTVNGVAEEK